MTGPWLRNRKWQDLELGKVKKKTFFILLFTEVTFFGFFFSSQGLDWLAYPQINLPLNMRPVTQVLNQTNLCSELRTCLDFRLKLSSHPPDCKIYSQNDQDWGHRTWIQIFPWIASTNDYEYRYNKIKAKVTKWTTRQLSF